ncbi:DNA polymerase III subunit delta [Leucothrix pacifica]|uniref:DNA polymerase III subunit delta n=1 Tax=Leucothrix pacifica TaxID=1247513 RepID=A0A317CN25_9GAMM|nr:DNA polymerase III subunit delta [Leucothrix pacifica]PWQ97712.1 DNA polymerase III subunit delta [Leucothrix pacifica]
MNVQADQLMRLLGSDKPLSPVYLLSGDEPLQMMEAADAIRRIARKQGYTEREILRVETGFEWSSLGQSADEMSLFSQRKVLDLRLEKQSPGAKGSKALVEYVKRLPEDKILLITCQRMDGRQKNSAWVKALSNAGVMVQFWDLSLAQTLGWVAKRLRQNGMQPTQEAVRLLTERVEGNLLAAAQEIDKLKLLFGESEISEEQVLASVSDSARFSVFDLSTAITSADSRRVQHILYHLRQEGTATPLVLWVVNDLVTQLSEASHVLRNGGGEQQAMSKIPKPRQKLLQPALRRLQSADWIRITEKAVEVDRLIKGLSQVDNKGDGRVWVALLDLSLLLAGSDELSAA